MPMETRGVDPAGAPWYPGMVSNDDADLVHDAKHPSGRVEVVHRLERVICLRVLEGPLADPDRLRAFDRRRVLGGNAAMADLRLQDWALDETHFELRRDGDRVWLEDLRSTRGTFVEETRVDAIVLVPGTVFTAGSSSIQYMGLAPVDVPVSSRDCFGGLHGCSTAMREAFALLEESVDCGIEVTLQGESGTGKTLAAQAIHERSDRRDGPFVVLDCSTLNGEAAQFSLLGHRAGVVPGILEGRAGCFEQAHGGTLFIDNIDELPLALQPMLARAIDCREVMRLGEAHWRQVDFSLIVSTERNMRHMVAKGRFRDHIYFRLPARVIELPPLREREGDVPLLAARFADELGVPDSVLSEGLFTRLEAHAWPGNVRELRAIVRAAVAMEKRKCPDPDRLLLHADARVPAFSELAALPFEEASQAFERHYLVALLRVTEGELHEAEARSGITSERLRERLRVHGLSS